MRPLFSVLSAALSLLMAVLALPTLWIDARVASESGFVELLSPLEHDKEFQAGIASSVSASAVENSGIPAMFQGPAEGIIQGIADSITSDPGFPEAWRETVAASHRLNFSDEAVVPAAVSFETAPLVNLMLSSLGEAIGFQPERVESAPLRFGYSQHREGISSVQNLAAIGLPLLIGSVLALSLALLFARRRGPVLLSCGSGLLLIAALFKVGVGIGAWTVARQAEESELATLFRDRVLGFVTADFDRWLLVVAALGLVLIVAGIVLVIRRRRALQGLQAEPQALPSV